MPGSEKLVLKADLGCHARIKVQYRTGHCQSTDNPLLVPRINQRNLQCKKTQRENMGTSYHLFSSCLNQTYVPQFCFGIPLELCTSDPGFSTRRSICTSLWLKPNANVNKSNVKCQLCSISCEPQQWW